MDLSVGNLGLSMEDGPVYECSTVKFGPNSQDKLVWKHVDQDGFHFVPVVGRTSYCPENHQICGASLCKKWQPNVFLHCIPISVTHGYTIHHNSAFALLVLLGSSELEAPCAEPLPHRQGTSTAQESDETATNIDDRHRQSPSGSLWSSFCGGTSQQLTSQE